MIRQTIGSKKTKKRMKQFKRQIAVAKRKKERKQMNKTIQNFLPIDRIVSP